MDFNNREALFIVCIAFSISKVPFVSLQSTYPIDPFCLWFLQTPQSFTRIVVEWPTHVCTLVSLENWLFPTNNLTTLTFFLPMLSFKFYKEQIDLNKKKFLVRFKCTRTGNLRRLLTLEKDSRNERMEELSEDTNFKKSFLEINLFLFHNKVDTNGWFRYWIDFLKKNCASRIFKKAFLEIK